MAEPVADSRQLAVHDCQDDLLVPQRYLSSVDAGWKGLVAEAFREPRELEHWIVPATTDASIILFTGGGMRLEQRHANGGWKPVCVRHQDLVLYPGGASREMRWTSLSTMPTRTLHLKLSRSLLARTAEEFSHRDRAPLSLMPRSGFQDPLLTQIGLALWHELEQHTPTGSLYAETAAHMLAVHLLRYHSTLGDSLREPTQGLTQKQLQRVIDRIRDQLGEDLSLETLAQEAGFSPYHFARLFRQATGESPHKFVLRQRVERARQLLKETDAPLAQVALESGFANQSHLTQAFKRHLGLTPRMYRQDRSI